MFQTFMIIDRSYAFIFVLKIFSICYLSFQKKIGIRFSVT